jgi:hypothetical protein
MPGSQHVEPLQDRDIQTPELALPHRAAPAAAVIAAHKDFRIQ